MSKAQVDLRKWGYETSRRASSNSVRMSILLIRFSSFSLEITRFTPISFVRKIYNSIAIIHLVFNFELIFNPWMSVIFYTRVRLEILKCYYVIYYISSLRIIQYALSFKKIQKSRYIPVCIYIFFFWLCV